MIARVIGTVGLCGVVCKESRCRILLILVGSHFILSGLVELECQPLPTF
jgi:hypothetical protein